MRKLQTYALVWVMVASVAYAAESDNNNPITATEYRAELDQLSSVAQQLDSTRSPIPQVLEHVPQSWHVRTEHGQFEISTEGLHQDLRRYEREKDSANAAAIQVRIQSLRRDLDEYEQPSADVSSEWRDLNSILARPEFRDVHGPTWLDLLKQKVLSSVIHLLERMFRSASIPTISRFLVYGVMGLAVLGLAYFVYRSMVWGTGFEVVTPQDVPVSAKEWTVWLAEARSVAAQNEWRDAIHFAYWAGISFLEHQGAWKPDRARTPREYLKLIRNSSEQREPLTVLTRMFELVWYAKQDANDTTFSEALAALERLGCR